MRFFFSFALARPLKRPLGCSCDGCEGIASNLRCTYVYTNTRTHWHTHHLSCVCIVFVCIHVPIWYIRLLISLETSHPQAPNYLYAFLPIFILSGWHTMLPSTLIIFKFSTSHCVLLLKMKERKKLIHKKDKKPFLEAGVSKWTRPRSSLNEQRHRKCDLSVLAFY